MLFNSLILLLLSNSITSRRDKSILISKIMTTIIIISTLAYVYLYFVLLANIRGNSGELYLSILYLIYLFILFSFLGTGTPLLIITLFILIRGEPLKLVNSLKNYNLVIRNYITGLRIKLIFCLNILTRRYLSSSLNKNCYENKRMNKYLSYFVTLTVIIFIPHGLEISLCNYIHALICFIFVGIIIYDLSRDYLSRDYLLYNHVFSWIFIIASHIDGLIISIVEESLIPDKFTCILVFIGLFMLTYNLTLENPHISLQDRIIYIRKNWKYILLIIIGFLILRIILAFFGILLLDKNNFILFIITAFARLVFFNLIFAVGYSIHNKRLCYNMFSLNVYMTLIVISVLYTYVFCIFPLIILGFSEIISKGYLNYSNIYNYSKNIVMGLDNDLYVTVESYKQNFTHITKQLDTMMYNRLPFFQYLFACVNYSIQKLFFSKSIECAGPGSWDKLMQRTNSPLESDSDETSEFIKDRAHSISPRPGKKSANYIDIRDDSAEGNKSANRKRKLSYIENVDNPKKKPRLQVNPVLQDPLDKNSKNNTLEDRESTSPEVESNLLESKEERRLRLSRETHRRFRINHPHYHNNIYHAKKHYMVHKPEDPNITINKKILRMGRIAATSMKNDTNYVNSLLEGNWTEEDAKHELSIKEPISLDLDNRPLWLFDINNETKGHYLSARDAGDDLGKEKSSIQNAVKQGSTTKCILNEGNVYTKYGESYKLKKIELLDEHLPREVKDQLSNAKKQGTSVIAKDADGEETVFPSKNAVQKTLGLDRKGLDRGYLDKDKVWTNKITKKQYRFRTDLSTSVSHTVHKPLIYLSGMETSFKMAFKSIDGVANYFQIEPSLIIKYMNSESPLEIQKVKYFLKCLKSNRLDPIHKPVEGQKNTRFTESKELAKEILPEQGLDKGKGKAIEQMQNLSDREYLTEDASDEDCIFHQDLYKAMEESKEQARNNFSNKKGESSKRSK